MKNYKPISPIGLLFAGCLCMLQSSAVFAAAGQLINNRATLNYDVGGTNTVLESSTAGNTTLGGGNGADTVFVEDRVINIAVAEVGGASTSVASSATDQALEFTVTNNGNGTQDVLLAALERTGTADPHGGAADTVTIVTFNAFVEDGTTVGYQVAEDTGIFIQDLAPAASRTVYIVSNIPAALSNNETAVMTLVAQAAATSTGGTNSEAVAADAGTAITNDDNNNISPAGTYSNGATAVVAGTANNAADVIGTLVDTDQIVFNDPAGGTAADVDSAGTVQDAARNGQSSDTDSYLVGAPVLTVQKVVGSPVFDAVNSTTNPKAIPTAVVPYTITISNAGGAGTASLTNITDTLAANLAIETSVTSDGTTLLTGASAGDSFYIDNSGTARPSAAVDTHYCTDSVAADTDGCTDTGGAGATITIDFTDVNIPGMGVEAGYTQGELKAGESISIRFNVIIQ